MAEKTSTSIRIEPEIKVEAVKVFKSLGFDFSTGIDIYLRAVVRERRIPFDLSLDNKVTSND